MKYPYALFSDPHAHAWSMFSTLDPLGINSRLTITLDEIDRMAAELEAAGGDTIVLAGDLFHTRGLVDPEVFNPVFHRIDSLIQRGFGFIAIPGNHDLKGKETTALGNSFQSLGRLPGFEIAIEPRLIDDLLMIPWQSTNAGLHEAIKTWIDTDTSASWVADAAARAKIDLIIHAGIDGVLAHMPDHGLPACDLKSYGFRRVFAGHYHHHASFEDRVISIGASAHQTWSDVGTKAGFLLVWPDRFKHFATHAPRFVDFTPDTDPEELPFIAAGNYVRVRNFKMTNEEIKAMEIELRGMSARGISFQVARETTSARTAGAPTKILSLEASLAKYCANKFTDPVLGEAVYEACGDVLTSVTSIAA